MNGQPRPQSSAAGYAGRGSDRAVVATLLSGLVLPGLGQIYLRRRRRGAILLALLAVGFFVLVSEVVEDALQLMERFEQYADVLDLRTALDLGAEAFAPGGKVYAVCLGYLAALWLFSIVDAWRIGKRQGSASGSPAG